MSSPQSPGVGSHFANLAGQDQQGTQHTQHDTLAGPEDECQGSRKPKVVPDTPRMNQTHSHDLTDSGEASIKDPTPLPSWVSPMICFGQHVAESLDA